ncbi:hypothetical protein ABIC33_006492 [Variovorax sp. 1140]
MAAAIQLVRHTPIRATAAVLDRKPAVEVLA